MTNIYSEDKQHTGLFRAFIVQPNDAEASVYIPALHRSQMPFIDPSNPSAGVTEKSELNMKLADYPVAQLSSWRCRPELHTGDAVLLSFENGDSGYPVIVGYLGSTLEIYSGPGAYGSSGSGSSSGAAAGSSGNGVYTGAAGPLLMIAGHGGGDPGACGNGYEEYKLTRELVNLTSSKLGSKLTHSNVVGENQNEYKDQACNFADYAYVLEVHFNASSGNAAGTELLLHSSNSASALDNDILNAVASVGFKNRGIVPRSDLRNMNRAKSSNTSYSLIEVCFIDNASDIALYQSKKSVIAENLANVFVKHLKAAESKYVKGSGQGSVFNSTPIMGNAVATYDQMVTFLKQNNPSAPDYVMLYLQEGAAEGVRGDIAFAQSCCETGYWRFGGDVKASQNNFAGIGATGGGVAGNSFPSPQIGIRAQIQHLKAYASTAPLNGNCVDPRFTYVTRGSAKTIGELSGKWATATSYDNSIVGILNKILSQ